jgi:hypothetical protein
LGDDREEVEQSALGQRRADGSAPLAFAQLFVVDVRMRDIRVGRGPVRL